LTIDPPKRDIAPDGQLLRIGGGAMAVLVDDLAAAAVKTAARPGLRWRYGPVCLPGEHKAYHTDLETYLGWIAEVESHTHNTSEAAQRIRMVYYSKTAGSRLFDLVLSSEASRLGAPLTLAHAWQPALDGIMGTGELMTGLDGAGRPLPPVDVSHFWVIADRERNGLAPLGEALDLESNAHGGMSWTGDLASWWTSYNDKRLAAMLQARDEGRTWSEPTDPTGLAVPLDWLEQATAARCSRSDLYGDMDAIVLSNDVAQLPLIPGTPISEPISDLLRRYYGPSHIVIPYSQLHADNRFHLFVHRAKPAIPHNYDAGTGQVSLRDEARDVIRSHIQRPLRCLLRVARLWAGKAFFTHFSLAPLADQLAQKGLVALAIEASVEADITSPWGREMLNRVADRFTAFLRQGLAAGGWAGDWPREPSPLEDYGGFELRLGDNDLARRYGGQANAVSQWQPYVVRLQQRLIDLGFTAVRAADGDFGVRTAIALRELQTEARRDHVYEATPPPAATWSSPRQRAGSEGSSTACSTGRRRRRFNIGPAGRGHAATSIHSRSRAGRRTMAFQESSSKATCGCTTTCATRACACTLSTRSSAIPYLRSGSCLHCSRCTKAGTRTATPGTSGSTASNRRSRGTRRSGRPPERHRKRSSPVGWQRTACATSTGPCGRTCCWRSATSTTPII
jgi:hypothetical protein